MDRVSRYDALRQTEVYKRATLGDGQYHKTPASSEHWFHGYRCVCCNIATNTTGQADESRSSELSAAYATKRDDGTQWHYDHAAILCTTISLAQAHVSTTYSCARSATGGPGSSVHRNRPRGLEPCH